MKATLGFGLAALTAALDFQWSYEGQNYWATEVDRIDKSDDQLGLASHIGESGLGYFKVGDIEDWPQFCRSVASPDLDPGAYVVAVLSGQLVIAKAYQVMPDTAMAFTEAIVPDCEGSYKPFPGDGIPVVPVAVGDGPLAGLRFATKDLFHVKGVKTGAGSRSYYEAYPPQNHTSGVVLKFIDGGASLVGKTKTTQFALTTARNAWDLDYQNPWNPRGDGYLSPGGSSSGSGAAVGSYDWLDFAIGSDTGGSVRIPAELNGIFGYRPSQGFYDLVDVVPCVVSLDTPGFFARSPEVFTTLFDVWSEDTELALDNVSLPSKLTYWAEQTPIELKEAQDTINDFFSQVEATFNMTSSSLNLTDTWLQNSGTGETIKEYYSTVYDALNGVESWDLIGVPLFEAYGDLHSGAAPPLDPSTNLTWAYGQDGTARSEYEEAKRRGQEFRDFYGEHVLRRVNASSCTDSIAAFTHFVDQPFNRLEVIPFARTAGWWDMLAASYGGVPEISVPIGQVPYWSNFTRQTEFRPIAAAFQAARGCDAVLFKLVDELTKAGLVKEVVTGKVPFS